ncbi:uncharacterized protein PAC_02382 [Phialocephala subalpina]|uniref:Uncharacterized protein n=1 Tax=Phialocephala subalpina TaxID=576137 RepID=A0A1L7WIB7_9HELO|nr:uncharacterized protein PAC_02382 [Phialocephala subalpina]
MMAVEATARVLESAAISKTMELKVKPSVDTSEIAAPPILLNLFTKTSANLQSTCLAATTPPLLIASMLIDPKQEIEYFSAALEFMDDTTLSNLYSQIIPIIGDGSVPMYPPAQHGSQQTQANGRPPCMNQLDTLTPLALLGQAINAQGGAAGQGQGTGGSLPATTSITVTQTITTLHARPSTIVQSSNSWILFRADRQVMVRAFSPPAALVETSQLKASGQKVDFKVPAGLVKPQPLSPSLRYSTCALRSSPTSLPRLTSFQSTMPRLVTTCVRTTALVQSKTRRI